MTKNAYWDELGIAWRAVHPETETVVPRLSARLRNQSFLIAAGILAGLLLGLTGALLGAYTLWRGWSFGPWNFVTRGGALLAASGLVSVAALGLLPVMRGDQARALPDMIDLTIARADRLLVTVRLGLWTCALLAVLGLVGTAIRTYAGHPPATSPIEPLAILGILALALLLYGRHATLTRRKFRYLKEILVADGD